MWSYLSSLLSLLWQRSPVSKYIVQNVLYLTAIITFFTPNYRSHWQTLAEGVSFRSSFQGGGFPKQTSKQASLCGEADSAALHADFQAIRGLAAGIHDAAIHVARAAAVVAQFVGAAAAAAASLGRAGSARGLRHHHVAKCQELTKEAGQDAVDAAVWVKMSEAVRIEHASTTHDRKMWGYILNTFMSEDWWGGGQKPGKKKSKEVNFSPAVLIKRVLSNCSIIMQTARLIKQGWLAKSESLCR